MAGKRCPKVFVVSGERVKKDLIFTGKVAVKSRETDFGGFRDRFDGGLLETIPFEKLQRLVENPLSRFLCLFLS